MKIKIEEIENKKKKDNKSKKIGYFLYGYELLIQGDVVRLKKVYLVYLMLLRVFGILDFC